MLTAREVSIRYSIKQCHVYSRFAPAMRVIGTAASGRRIIRFDEKMCDQLSAPLESATNDGRGLPNRVLTDAEIDDYNRRCPFRRDILAKFLRAFEHLQDRRTTFDRGMRVNRNGNAE